MAIGRLPEESRESAKIRDELLEAEIALRDQRERVAELRRKLPEDTVATDYVFQEGPGDLAAGDAPVREVRLSELVQPGRPLLLVHFMYGGAQDEPCPMCTMWADGYTGVVQHLEQRADFAIVIAGELAPFRAYARERGWKNVRILTSQGCDFKRDLGTEMENGAQIPAVSVFTRGADGGARHFYTGSAFMAPGQFRGMDLLSPVWNFLDLTPEGRGDFMPSRSYGSRTTGR
jgi:predicted dithiol-disulfide oxidoreductase (DUF899 family)